VSMFLGGNHRSYLRLRDKHGLDGFGPHPTAQRLPSPSLRTRPIMRDELVHCVVNDQGSNDKRKKRL
jgi:hypothetical protein